MRAPPFFTDDTKARAAEAVKAIEARTSAEVVIAVHARSGDYSHTDYLVGFALSFVTLVAMLYLPQEFPLETFPPGSAVSFLVGALVCRSVPALRRVLSGRAPREKNVRTAARAAFVDLGISRTRGRTGLLVFVSLFERQVEVVPDTGVDPAALGPEWIQALAGLNAALARSSDPAPFFQALHALTPPLERVLPRAQDDVNELPDAPHHAA
jgi:putative membrane protein